MTTTEKQSEREFTLFVWSLMIQFIRAYGRYHGLCVDVQIVKEYKDNG